MRPWLLLEPLERAEWLSPDQFLRLHRRSPKTIKSVQVLPPQIGAADFGTIRVVRQSDPELQLTGK
jgi:hypothetical protein